MNRRQLLKTICAAPLIGLVKPKDIIEPVKWVKYSTPCDTTSNVGIEWFRYDMGII
ncbi:hypothetical protein LCGC14_0343500 [marine sediment metagenome]|uniref:Uncharacterized protein n=1 Tax=marine sediment metagenome TaxID=412755 RepID=A0A0F9TW28_9ZZZZ